MKRDDDKELWNLLGSASQPSLSPFFARNVSREIRSSRGGWRSIAAGWLAPRRVVATAAALAICVATALTVWQKEAAAPAQDGDDIPDVVARVDPSDYQVVADLDDLLAAQEDDSWDDTATL